jgi:hypothetical protein
MESKDSKKPQTSLYLAKHLFIVMEDTMAPIRSTKDPMLMAMSTQMCMEIVDKFQTKWVQEIQSKSSPSPLNLLILFLLVFRVSVHLLRFHDHIPLLWCSTSLVHCEPTPCSLLNQLLTMCMWDFSSNV